ncbi:MAG: hypothetical protein II221_05820, partial [Paludibacteraceae bacterium]|nr:hypothetical protein [Paludibacteraceae bacterium]
DLGTNLVDAFFDLWDKGYAAEGLNMQTLVDAFFAGFLSSLVLSGYHIGRNAARSARVNRKAKKTGDYDHDNGFGPGDIVFETVVDGESKFQKVGPLGKLYYSSILRDFDEALKTLEKSRMQGSAPDIELAQEVYTGLSQMAQYFQGFDKKRLLNCQRLLNALSGEEISVTSYMHGMQERLQVDDAAVRQQKFVSDVYEILRDMPKSALPNMDKLRSIARRVAPAEVIAVADKSGTKKRRGRPRKADKTSEKAPTGEALTEKLLAAQRRADELLGEKEEKTLEELARDFNLVIVTDGKEVDFDDDYKTLAVPAAWLKNYSRMPIWQTITQTQLVRKLCVQSPKTQGILLFFDRRVRPVVEKYFKNSGKKDTKNLRRETVVMQFLFNPIVYQEVLLGENGAIHEHTNVLQVIFEHIYKELKEQSNKAIQRKALDDVYRQICETMALPTMKAVINFNYNPTTISATRILNDKQKEFLQQFQRRKQTISLGVQTGQSSDYSRLLSDLIDDSDFTEEEKAFILRVKNNEPGVTDRERLIVQAML